LQAQCNQSDRVQVSVRVCVQNLQAQCNQSDRAQVSMGVCVQNLQAQCNPFSHKCAVISEYAPAWQARAQASPNPLCLKVLQRAAVPANPSDQVGKNGDY